MMSLHLLFSAVFPPFLVFRASAVVIIIAFTYLIALWAAQETINMTDRAERGLIRRRACPEKLVPHRGVIMRVMT
jgi:hypothetical protein